VIAPLCAYTPAAACRKISDRRSFLMSVH
jgi:hypothetical protein